VAPNGRQEGSERGKEGMPFSRHRRQDALQLWTLLALSHEVGPSCCGVLPCHAVLCCVQVNEQFTTYTATDVAEGLQDFLICIEMFLAALAHAYAFPPRVSTAFAGPTHAFLAGL